MWGFVGWGPSQIVLFGLASGLGLKIYHKNPAKLLLKGAIQSCHLTFHTHAAL